MERLFQQGADSMRRIGAKPGVEQLESRIAPAVYHVDPLQDTEAVDLQTGQDAAGHVSLRSAMMAANASPGEDEILLGAGIFRLTQPGPGEDLARTGDLDVHGDLSIQGSGSSNTVLDSSQVERLFEVFQSDLHL